MRLSCLQAVLGLFLAAILSAPAWGATTPLPGTLNYLEGQAKIGAEALTPKSIGSVQLQKGQSLSTAADGRVEILLTPGVFLRLGDNSSARMISTRLTRTEVALNRGHAMVEVDQIHKANDIRIAEDNATTRLMKTGLYDFDARQNQVRVFDGEAMVRVGDQRIKVKGGHEVTLDTTGKLKAQKFNKKDDESASLYRFSSLRSDYLAAANAQAYQVYVNYGWWPAAGWWWDPWFGGYTYLPLSGFYSPFGWGFYPVGVFGGPWGFYRNRVVGGPWGFYGSRVVGGPRYHPGFAMARGGAPANFGHESARAGGFGYGGIGFHGGGFGFHGR